MKVSGTTSTTTAIGAALTASFVGMAGASTASADQATTAATHGFGSQATIVNGDVVQGWTISDLKPSSDAIPYPVKGTLWEATATDEAIKGSAIPIVPNLDARTPNGQTYPALFQVATAQGVNPATLPQGQKTTGKVYFDVTGDKPTGVVYDTGGQDLASWTESKSPQRHSDSTTTTISASGPGVTPTPAAAPVAAAGQQAPVVKPATPAPVADQGTPATGRQGIPMPVNGPTPAPEAGPATPPPAGGPETAAPASPPAATGPANSQGSAGSPATPAPDAGPATPTPASPPPATGPANSQGSAGSPATPAPDAGPATPNP